MRWAASRSCLAAILVTACAHRPPSVPPEDNGAALPTLPELARSEIQGFLTAVGASETDPGSLPTPSEWTANRPGDSLALRGKDDETQRFDDFEGAWCARASHVFMAGKADMIVRHAYFYPPRMPKRARLPEVSDHPGRALEECRLGSLVVRRSVSGVADTSLAAPVVDVLSKALGEGRLAAFPPRVVFPRRPFTTWRLGPATVTAGAQVFYRSTRVEADAWIPTAGYELTEIYDPVPRLEAVDPPLLDSLGLDGATGARLLAVNRAPVADAKAAEAWAVDVARELGVWLRDAENADPEVQAAALLVGHRVLERSELVPMATIAGMETLRERITGLGVRLIYERGDEFFGQDGALLLRAFEIARGTPIGDRAFVQLLADGMDPKPGCPAIPGFQQVIERGERYLEVDRPSSIEPELLLRMHLYIALAYADIVAIDEGIVPLTGYATAEEEPVVYGPAEAAAARRRSVAHYQAALDLMPDSTFKRKTWRDAWRLAAGLHPLDWTYLCSNE